MKLYGATASPFVRKCRIVLEEKGLPYELENPVPGLHPLGKMPVLHDGDVVVPDSSVISAYLEKTHPLPALYPEDPAELARALFLEEYGDTQMSEGMGAIVLERIVKPNLLGQPTDVPRLKQLLESASTRWRGKATSAAKLPRPVTRGRSSRRVTDRPTKRMSGPRRRGSRAQRRADALRRRGELVDRDAERRERVVDGVDDGSGRADRAALAQSLGLGEGCLRFRLHVMDFD